MQRKYILGLVLALFAVTCICFVCVSCSTEKCVIVYHTNSEEKCESNAFNLTDIELFELPTPSKNGYSFAGWYLDNDFEVEYSTSRIKSGINELYAKWIKDKCAFIYHTNSAIECKTEVIDISEVESFQLPELVRDGYLFSGWYMDSGFNIAYDSAIIKDDYNELFAKWEPEQYKIVVYIDGHIEKEYIYYYTERVNLEALNKSDFVFRGYYFDSAFTKEMNYDYMPAFDFDLYAKFEKEQFELEVFVSDEDAGFIDGNTRQLLAKDEQSTVIKAVPNLGYKFVRWSNDCFDEEIQVSITEPTNLTAIFAIDCLELPIMQIYTNNRKDIDSKDDYLSCSVSVLNSEYNNCFYNADAKIKGRGNSTWGMPKKPYKLKFNKKTNLFGNGEAKTWVLLANYADPSLARNYLAYSLGKELGVDYVTEIQNVDLYVNGEYLGVYLICEQNEVGQTRVDIDESYESTNTGYLLELDERAPEEGTENYEWFTFENQYYAIKSPDTENDNYSSSFVNYIKTYLTESMSAIKAQDWVAINEYVNIDSFVKAYVINELMKSGDIHFLSFYLYKDKNGKLGCGPIWDYDLSSGNYKGKENVNNPTEFCATSNIWFEELLKNREFVEAVSLEIKMSYITLLNSINRNIDILYNFENSFVRNNLKWETLGIYVWPNPDELVAIDTWAGQVEYLRDWLLKSLDFIYNYYVDCAAEAYSIILPSGKSYEVKAINTNNIEAQAIVLNNAWSRDLETGELVNDGSGCIILKVLLKEGYKLKQITIEEASNYVELLTIDENIGLYKILGISGNITINVETEELSSEPQDEGYFITFVHDDNISIMVYPGKDYSIDGTICDSCKLLDMSGDGQINFKVIVPDGYIVNGISIVGRYKNIKGPSDTEVDNVYRVTKVTGDLQITISTNSV